MSSRVSTSSVSTSSQKGCPGRRAASRSPPTIASRRRARRPRAAGRGRSAEQVAPHDVEVGRRRGVRGHREVPVLQQSSAHPVVAARQRHVEQRRRQLGAPARCTSSSWIRSCRRRVRSSSLASRSRICCDAESVVEGDRRCSTGSSSSTTAWLAVTMIPVLRVEHARQRVERDVTRAHSYAGSHPGTGQSPSPVPPDRDSPGAW